MSTPPPWAIPRRPHKPGCPRGPVLLYGRSQDAIKRGGRRSDETYGSIRTDDDSRRRLFPGADRCADCHPRQGVRLREDGLTRHCCSHSSGFGFERRRGDGAFDHDGRARLPSCWARRQHPDRTTPRQRIGVIGAVEDSGLRISETGERERLRRR
jgi:hypothetical protein